MTIQEMFRQSKDKIAFMPYICCGDPNVSFSIELIKTLIKNNASAIELGIPFSDPIADGKTIQTASNRALKNGITPQKCLEIIPVLREENISVPIIVMTYYNIIYAKGIELFLKSMKKRGATGLIVPDVPFEESDILDNSCKNIGIDLIYLITPNCSDERIKKISQRASGFLYAVMALGITGVRINVLKSASSLIRRAKRITNIPIVAGFGISQRQNIEDLKKAGADGFIIGSKIIDIYSKHIKDNNNIDTKKALDEIIGFCKGLF